MKAWIAGGAMGLMLASCNVGGTNEYIEKWNADFSAQKQQCESGNHLACQVACQMSINRQVCTEAAKSAETPAQRQWVAQCERDVAEQGRAACAAVNMVNPNDAVKRIAAPVPQAPPMATPPTGGAPAPATPEATDPHAARESALQQAMRNRLLSVVEPAPTPPAERDTAADSAGPVGDGGKAVVTGALPMEVIRRIVHRNHSRIRFCYEKRLAEKPDLAGNVTVKFIISGTGQVQMAAVSHSTAGDPELEQCVSTAVRSMSFPAPEGGGIVIVTYPFEFKSE